MEAGVREASRPGLEDLGSVEEVHFSAESCQKGEE